jgi:hypothetical protein
MLSLRWTVSGSGQGIEHGRLQNAATSPAASLLSTARTISCEGEKSIKGLHVRSWSGISRPPETVCEIEGRDDVIHVVEITNLRLYDLDVDCAGLVVSVPPKAVFRSIDGADALTSWNGKTAIEEGGTYQFDQFNIRSCSSGFEKIRVYVASAFAEGLGYDRVDLAIDVIA